MSSSAVRAIRYEAGPLIIRTEWDTYLTYVAMVLLLISTIQGAGLIRHAVTVAWLIAVVVLAVFNVGAALGVYIAAAAVYAVLTFDGWGSVVERPDNYALLVVAGSLSARILATRAVRLWEPATLVIGSFVAYGLLHLAWIGPLTRISFAGYMRMFALPMLMFLLLMHHRFRPHELRALMQSLLVLGAYMGIVSILERAEAYNLIVPAWIGTPSLSYLVPSRYSSIDTGRSGGILMQSEYNGLALSLIFCITVLFGRTFNQRGSAMPWLAGLLCIAGIITTFTRAAWLACAAASIVLLWRRSTTPARTQLKRFGLIAASTAAILALTIFPHSFARQRIAEPQAVVLRLNLWKAAASMAADRPVLGSGFSTFSGNLEQYAHEMTIGTPIAFRETVPHNMTLGILVELGAIGLMLYLGALVTVFRKARATSFQTWGREGTAWIAVFTGVYVFQLQFMQVGDSSTHHLYFSMMGAIAGLRLRRDTRDAPSRHAHFTG